jgi:ubiquinone/menaquinone biosynthesis C-methylase UbiE
MNNLRQAYYDRFSHFYDRFVALHSSDRQGDLRAYFAGCTGVLPGDRVLDICCGTGTLLKRLHLLVGTDGLVVGLDFSRGMLSVARSKLASLRSVCLVQADAGCLPFRSDVFDAVTCAHAFYELKGSSQKACLQEILRVLKPAKPFLMIEHEIPRNRLVRTLFYLRLLLMGARRAIEILKKEKELLEGYFVNVQKLGTPTGHSKIWMCYRP